MTEDPNRIRVLISAQAALVGEIFPRIARVDVSWTSDLITFIYRVDSELDETDRDSITTIEAEMVAKLPNFEIVSEIVPSGAADAKRGMVCIFARRTYA